MKSRTEQRDEGMVLPYTPPLGREFQAGRPAAFSLAEIGGTGINVSGGRVFESRLRNLQGARRNIVLREMSETDSVVAGMLSAFTTLALTADRIINPGDEDTPADKEAADYVDGAIDDMSMGWKDTLGGIYTMLPFGHAPIEVVYKLRMGDGRDPTRRSKFDDGRIGWRKWALRPQDTIERWAIDDDGGIRGVYQRIGTTRSEEVFIPIEKMLLFRTSAKKNNPEGQSILEAAYRDWFYKRHFQELEAIGVKRDLAGFPVMSFPDKEEIWSAANQAKRTEAEKLVASIDRDEYEGLVKPLSVVFELLKGAGARQFDLEKIFARLTLWMAFATFTEFMTVGHEGSGSLALKRESVRLFLMAQQAYLEQTADIINRFAIPPLISLNDIPVTSMPWMTFGPVDKPNAKEIVEVLKSMVDAGAEVWPNDPLTRFLFALMGLPEPEEAPELRPDEEEEEDEEEEFEEDEVAGGLADDEPEIEEGG